LAELEKVFGLLGTSTCSGCKQELCPGGGAYKSQITSTPFGKSFLAGWTLWAWRFGAEENRILTVLQPLNYQPPSTASPTFLSPETTDCVMVLC